MNACTEFFERHRLNDEKVSALIEEPERIAWQRVSASPHSPGPVADEEEICRQVVHPVHIDDLGNPTPEAFGDVFNRGLSTHRLGHITLEEAVEKGQARAAEFNASLAAQGNADLTKHRTLMSLAIFAVAKLRTLTIDESSSTLALGVYDTANLGDCAHADVCVVERMSKMQRRSIRSRLWEACFKRPVAR